MRVHRADGCCRSCEGLLVIVDADDTSMAVQCEACDDSYLLEPDALGAGCMSYWLDLLADKLKGGETHETPQSRRDRDAAPETVPLHESRLPARLSGGAGEMQRGL